MSDKDKRRDDRDERPGTGPSKRFGGAGSAGRPAGGERQRSDGGDRGSQSRSSYGDRSPGGGGQGRGGSYGSAGRSGGQGRGGYQGRRRPWWPAGPGWLR